MNFFSVLTATASCLLAILVSGSAARAQNSATASYEPSIRRDTSARTSQAPSIEPLLFVGQGKPRQTTIYNAKNKPIGIVPAASGDSVFDAHGNFYDAPTNSGDLMVFAPPYRHQSLHIGFPDVIFGIAVDARSGILAVVLFGSASYVQFFRPGYATPCATVVARQGVLGTGSAFDREGRLFVEYGNSVAVIAGQCNATSIEVNQFWRPNIAPWFPFSFTSDDNLVFEDSHTYTVLTFAHPRNGRFARPLATTKLMPIGPKPMGLECFTGDGKYLWAYELPFGPKIFKYRYPQGGAPIASIRLVDQSSCAAYPPTIQ